MKGSATIQQLMHWTGTLPDQSPGPSLVGNGAVRHGRWTATGNLPSPAPGQSSPRLLHSQPHPPCQACTRCIMHAHMPYRHALTRLEDGTGCAARISALLCRIAPTTPSMNGLGAGTDAEGDRICPPWPTADFLFMATHGVMACGDSIANVFDDLYYLERAAWYRFLALRQARNCA